MLNMYHLAFPYFMFNYENGYDMLVIRLHNYK